MWQLVLEEGSMMVMADPLDLGHGKNLYFGFKILGYKKGYFFIFFYLADIMQMQRNKLTLQAALRPFPMELNQ